MLINRVKIYTNSQSKENFQLTNSDTSKQLETLGNEHATISCILNCSSPISESKDYKTLTKVFKKLMLNIENILVVNINNCKSNNFIHFIHEYNFSKIYIFGDEALMNNTPIKLEKLVPNQYEQLKILLVDNLKTLTNSQDETLKRKSWEAIQSFHKM